LDRTIESLNDKSSEFHCDSYRLDICDTLRLVLLDSFWYLP
jgi:hypothetical protein